MSQRLFKFFAAEKHLSKITKYVLKDKYVLWKVFYEKYSQIYNTSLGRFYPNKFHQSQS